jgi:hypothetical protein
VTGTDCSHCQEGYYLPRFGSLVVEAKTAKCEKQQDSKEAQTYKCAPDDGNVGIKITFASYQKGILDSYSSITLKFRVIVPRSANYSIALPYMVSTIYI